MPATGKAPKVATSAGARSAAMTTAPASCSRPRRVPGAEVREHLLADVAQVRRPRALVRVLQRVPDGRGRGHRVRPGDGGGLAAVEDAGPRGGEERLVLQEQQVGVEDGRVLLARAAGHRRSRPPDVGGRRLECAPKGAPLRLRRAGRGGREGRRRVSEPGTPVPRPRPARRRYPPGRRPAPAAPRPGRRRPGSRGVRAWAGRGGGLSLRTTRRLTEALVGQTADRRQRLQRLRPVGRDDQLVALPGAEGGDRVQAPGADRTASGGRVGDGDVGVEAGRGAHQQRGRPRVEAERVAHRHPRRLGGLPRRLGCAAVRGGRGQLLLLARQAAPCGGDDGPERVAERRRPQPRRPRPPPAAPRSAAPRRASPPPAGLWPAPRRGRRSRGPSGPARRPRTRPPRSRAAPWPRPCPAPPRAGPARRRRRCAPPDPPPARPARRRPPRAWRCG